jgi:hypothetical protein
MTSVSQPVSWPTDAPNKQVGVKRLSSSGIR